MESRRGILSTSIVPQELHPSVGPVGGWTIGSRLRVRFFSWGVPVNLIMGLIGTFQVSEQEYFMTLGTEGFVERIEKVLARSLHKRRARRKRNALLSDKSDEK